jgi:hypothetical protein
MRKTKALGAVMALVGVLPVTSCGRETTPELAGRWRAVRIEWTQNERRVRLTAEGRMEIGRLRLPTRPASFELIFQAMNTISVEVSQTGRDLRGNARATNDAPAALLAQAGARPGSIVAEFEGSLVNDTLGSVVVTTPDRQRREIVFVVQERGRRILARAVPVFGEAPEEASDVVLVPVQAGG